MRLVVTGGSGFLGGFVLREAAARGYEVAALARSPAAAAAVRALGARPVGGDLAAPGPAAAAALAEAFAAGDVLVNLASLGFGDAPAIVAAAERAQVRGAVFVSTTAVTTTLPAASKRVRLAAEQRIAESALDWIILRPTMIYGAPGDRNLSRLLPLLCRVPVLPVPGGGHLQQPVHVADVAHAVLAAAELIGAELAGSGPAGSGLADCGLAGSGLAGGKPAGVTYDLAGPVPLTFGELLRTAGQAVGSRTRFVPVPLPPVLAAARGYELVSRSPRIRAEQVRRLAEDKAFGIRAAARDLGFAPRSFAAGIRSEARALGLAA
ncbi:MAG TPA: NAD(P)H-binding protein [Streptosporangiaceae bacterium]|nr:NAD(P)H-binding protein [Streptosporangiaceae bacterium]